MTTPDARDVLQPRSGSTQNAAYWWYQARERLLATFFRSTPVGETVLEVGSADSPSSGWLVRAARWHLSVDLDRLSLPRMGVCADGASLPLRDGSFGVVAAFDVIEHFADDDAVTAEIRRVLRPGGHALVSVPAYQWAFSRFDELAGHQRRYTRRSVTELLGRHGFTVDRASYAFAATFPIFVADRLRSRLLGKEPERVGGSRLPPWVGRRLLDLARIDEWQLRRGGLPLGSSVLIHARRD